MNYLISLGLHLALFALLWFAGQFAFRNKEIVIPIDLTVVVEENLDGKENEPPPLEKPKPEPPPPPKPPEPKPEPPPEPKETPKVEAVEQVKEVKKEEIKKPPKPEKTEAEKKKEREEARKKRLEDMRKRAQDAPTPKPVRDGRTEKKTLTDEQIRKLLQQGYKPGTSEQIAPNEESMCLGFLKQAIDTKWRELLPKIGRVGVVYIEIRFDRSGRIATSSLAQTSGDATTDAAAMKVVRSLGVIRGLTSSFLFKYSQQSITIRYKVEGF